MRDDDQRLTAMTSPQFLENGKHAAADVGEGFASRMGELQVAEHPAPFGLGVDFPSVSRLKPERGPIFRS